MTTDLARLMLLFGHGVAIMALLCLCKLGMDQQAVTNRLLSERIDAVLILPTFMRCWLPVLQQLPVVHGHELS